MKLTGIQKRALRRARNHDSLDMNLVSLIDIFTILIFFLMANSGVEVLTSSKAVKLPESTVQKAPKETLTIVVNNQDILVDGRRVAAVADFLNSEDDVIGPLKAELDLLATVRKSVRSTASKDGGETKSQAITILGDKDIPYRLLRKIMVTAARANFSDISFAVQHKAGSS
jgi:biopolymer transport protein TolR